jgi:UTP:GlnB (protein PII) uridylyltransferase
MRRSLLPGFVLAGLVLASPLAAQARDQIEVTRSQIQADRQAIVSQAMQLSDSAAQVFWPLYRAYRSDMARVGDRTVALLQQFAEKYQSMTNDDANRLLDEWISIQKEQLAVKEKHIKLFKKQLPAPTVARFFQVENKLDTIVQLDLVASIPLTR